MSAALLALQCAAVSAALAARAAHLKRKEAAIAVNLGWVSACLLVGGLGFLIQARGS